MANQSVPTEVARRRVPVGIHSFVEVLATVHEYLVMSSVSIDVDVG